MANSSPDSHYRASRGAGMMAECIGNQQPEQGEKTMVTIEHNGVKIECNENDAPKELRKLRAAEKRREKKDADNREIADTRALVAYARLVNRASEILDDDCGGYFEIATPDSGFGYEYLHVETKFSTNKTSFDACTEHGTAKVSVYDRVISGCMFNGAGFLCAVILDDKTEGRKIYSIGVSEDKVSLKVLPNRLMDIIISATEKIKSYKNKS